MSLAALRSSPRWFSCLRTLAVAVLLTLLATTGVLGLRYWHARQAIDQSFEHSRRVIDTLDRLRAKLFDLEGRRRRYLLTLDPAYLKSDGAYYEGVRRESEELQALVADDPLQSPRAANLALTVSATLGKMEEDVKTPPESGRSAALAIVVNMDEIRSQIDRMVDYQRFLHGGWREREASLERSKTWLIAAAVVIAGGFAGAALTLARREARRRRKTTEDLRRSEAYLAEAQKLTQTGSWALDPRGEKVLHCSDEMFRIYGLDPSESSPTREHFRQRVHPEDRDRVTEQIDKTLRDKAGSSFGEYRIVLPDGSIRHINTSGHPVVDEHGELIQWVGTAIDVTERKRAELERRHLVSLVEQAADLMAIADLSGGTPIYINKAGLKMVGFDSWEEARTRRGIHYMFPEDRPFVNEVLWPSVLKNGSWSGEMRFRHFKTGEPIPVFYSAFRMDDPETGQPVTVGNVCRDIAPLKRAEAQAREDDRRLREMQMELSHANRVATMGQLTASIAHEVNQPIAATVANAQAALRWLRADNLNEVQQALIRIVRDGNHAAEVIDRIRALIKKAPSRKDRLEINGAILEIIELTRAEAVKNNVSVTTELVNDLPLIAADRVQLQQVLLNLVVNALEAMSTSNQGPRELLIRTGKFDSDVVLVAVRDSGPGLDALALERMFESFYTTKPTGLGMGLSICRSIIEAHGGRLWASMNEESGGATLQFTLPAVPCSVER